jgi:hypothetical protein
VEAVLAVVDVGERAALVVGRCVATLSGCCRILTPLAVEPLLSAARNAD